MSIKDVIQSLVDDDRIFTEKVGSSSYYWCFDSKLRQTLTEKDQMLTDQLKSVNDELAAAESKLAIYTEDTDTPDPEKVKGRINKKKL